MFGMELPATRYQRARAILVGAQKAQSNRPFDVNTEGKANPLTYAAGLFRGVAARSVGAFMRAGREMEKEAQRMAQQFQDLTPTDA